MRLLVARLTVWRLRLLVDSGSKSSVIRGYVWQRPSACREGPRCATEFLRWASVLAPVLRGGW